MIVIVGQKYYDDENIYTVVRINKEDAVVSINYTDEVKTIPLSDFDNINYKLITPTGYIYSSIMVSTDKNYIDDIVFNYVPNRRNALNYYNDDNSPCGILATMYQLFGDDENSPSVIETLDRWSFMTEFDCIARNEHIHKMKVAVYIDISVKEYIHILRLNGILDTYEKYLKKGMEFCKEMYVDLKIENMEQLVQRLSFIYGIDFGLNIESIALAVKPLEPDNRIYDILTTDSESLHSLELVIGKRFDNIIIMKYWYDIDLTQIRMPFALIRNTLDDNLYLFLYRDLGYSMKSVADAFSYDELNKMCERLY